MSEMAVFIVGFTTVAIFIFFTSGTVSFLRKRSIIDSMTEEELTKRAYPVNAYKR